MYKKLIFLMLFLIVSCDNKPSYEKAKTSNDNFSTKYSSEINKSILKDFTYSNLIEYPSEDWIGRYIKIKFAKLGGISINGKTKIVFVKSFEKDVDGYSYLGVKDLSDDYLSEVYVFWFNNSQFGPKIISWEEAFPKKEFTNLDIKIEKFPPKGKSNEKGKTGKWTFFHDNGEIKYIQEFENDVENGKWLSFSDTGKLLAKGFFKAGLKDGKWISSYHPNGKVHIEEFYRMGRNIGTVNIFDVEGNLVDLNYHSSYDYYSTFDGDFHKELNRMAKIAESMGIYNHNVDAYHRALDAGDRNDIDSFIKALYDIDPYLDLDF